MRTTLLLLCLTLLSPALAQETFGPYRAEVVRVIDGDTIELAVGIWPGLTQRIHLRLDGIDTPEKRGRPECEKRLAEEASRFTAGFLQRGEEVIVTDIRPGKYVGRMLGRILVDGKDLSRELIAANLARPYSGGRRSPFCEG